MIPLLIAGMITSASIAPAETAVAEPSAWLGPPYWTRAFDAPLRQVVELDLQGDGWKELGVLTEGGRFIVLDLAGDLQWSYALPAEVVGPVVQVVDFDGDGRNEVMLGATLNVIRSDGRGFRINSGKGSLVIALDETGEAQWRRRFSEALGSLVPLVLPSAYGSGGSVLVQASDRVEAPVRLLDGTGNIRWTFRPPGGGAVAQVHVVPTGREQEAVILVGTANRFDSRRPATLSAVRPNGQQLWSRKLPDPGEYLRAKVRRIETLDVDLDGRLEILSIVTWNDAKEACLCLVRMTGVVDWCQPVAWQAAATGSLGRFSSPAGVSQIVVSGSKLETFDLSGRSLWEYSAGLPVAIGPGLVDVDGAGSGEIVVLFRQWKPPTWTAELRGLTLDGKAVYSRTLPGLVHRALEIAQGENFVAGAGHRRLVIDEHGIRGYGSTSSQSFVLVDDLNRDGRPEGVVDRGASLSLLSIPTPDDSIEVGLLHTLSEASSEPPIATALSGRGWAVIAGSAHRVADVLIRPGEVRLASSTGRVWWRQRIEHQAIGVGVGPARDGIEPGVFVLEGDENPESSGVSVLQGTGRLRALGSGGEERWRVALDRPPTALAVSNVSDEGEGMIVVGLGGRDPKGDGPARLVAFDFAGDQLWAVATSGAVLSVALGRRGVFVTGVSDQGREWFVTRLETSGRVLWTAPLDYPAVIPIVADLDGDGSEEVVVGDRCLDSSGDPLWRLPLDAKDRHVAVAASWSGETAGVVVASGDQWWDDHQIHVYDARGLLLLASGLPAYPTALSVQEATPSSPARIHVAIEPSDDSPKIVTLDDTGRILDSARVGDSIVGLSEVTRPAIPPSVMYATRNGGLGFLGPVIRSPPLLAAPALDLARDLYSLTVLPVEDEVTVDLQLWRPRDEAWESLGSQVAEGPNPVRLDWSVQPFGVRDVGRPVRMRFAYEGSDTAAVTEPVLLDSRLPLRWRYFQKAGLALLTLCLLAAVPGGALLYRWHRRRGPRYRDFQIRAVASRTGNEYRIDVQGPRHRRQFRHPFKEAGFQLADLASRNFVDAQAMRDRADALRSFLFDTDSRRRVFDTRRRTRLRLDFTQARALAPMPWELLLLPKQPRGGSDESTTTEENLLYEHLTVLRHVPPSQDNGTAVIPVIRPPLRVLLVTPNVTRPALRPVDFGKELEQISEVLNESEVAHKVEVTILQASETHLPSLARVIERGFDVVHFIGHATPSFLLLADSKGGPCRVRPSRIRELFLRSGSSSRLPFLLFLNSCHSAATLGAMSDALLGGNRLLALVGMQTAVPNDVARTFAERFYQILASSGRIDHAMLRGRQAIVSVLSGEAELKRLEWTAPVAFTSVDDGRLFEWM